MNPLSFGTAILLVAFCLTAYGCSERAGNTNVVPAPTTNSVNSIAVSNGNPAPPGARNAYPQQVVDEFLKSCKSAGSDAKFCACLLDRIQEKYSFEEFTVIELKLTSGSPPEEFVEFTGRAKAQCLSR